MHLMKLFFQGLDIGEWIEGRCLDCSRTPAGIGPREYFRSVTELVKWAISLREDWDVFFGVGLRRCLATNDMRQCPHRQVGKDHVSRLPAAWGDFDLKDHERGAGDDIASLLRGSDNAPRIMVQSGRGIHGYWPIPLTADLEGVERLNRGIRDTLGGDNAVDAARILRVAGTLNHKYGAPLAVRLLEA